jgi:tRNA1(Val) A37 N6-methylase TrmN6
VRNITNEIQMQKLYYAETARQYNSMHVDERDEHFFALSFLVAAIDYLQVRSILDIGSGTGRAILYIKRHRPDVRVVGIEPVKELREIGYNNGLSEEELLMVMRRNAIFCARI